MLSRKPRYADWVLTTLKIGALALLPLIAGIEIGDRAAAEAARSEITSGGGAANPALAARYRDYAETLETGAQDGTSTSDWADAQYFMHKAMAAERGDDQGPEHPGDWEIGADWLDDLEAARSDLLAAIAAYNALDPAGRELVADTIADARVSYDCWVERAEEPAPQAQEEASACRSNLERAIASFDISAEPQGLTASTGSTDP